jgi:hypothetical protein
VTSQDALTLSAAARSPDVREIGSDFELVEDRYLGPTTSRSLPWEDSAPIIYVQSGRQALAAAQAELRSQGHGQIHVPSYLCDSMITPFHNAGWNLRQLQVDSDLVVSPADLLSQVHSGVLLHTPYFGRQDSPALLGALQTLRQRGVVIIVDESHRLFSGPSQVADIRVASLRKMLPLFDGGYVTGLSRALPASPAACAEPEIADLREMASNAKSVALAAGDGNRDNTAHRAQFAKAEHATEVRQEPAQISNKSLALLHRLDMNLIRLTRRANASLLTVALGHSDRFRIINPTAANLLPSHLVLETGDVKGLRQYLTGQRIYCPVHWPPSELLPRTQEWPSRYISLPIDHRYGEPDMLRIAAEVATFFAGH